MKAFAEGAVNMTSQSEILEKLKSSEIEQYAKKLDLNNMLVFGSILTDDFNDESDVDIAVLGFEKLKITDILNLELFLEDILERPIDVVDLNSEGLDIFIKIDILNKGRSIYSSDNNKSLEKLIDKTEMFYRENENFFFCRRMDLLS